MKPKYAIICRRCVDLGREQTVHLRARPWAKSCAEHQRYAMNQRCYWNHVEKRRAAKARYNKANREAIAQKMREHRARKRSA